MVYQFVAALAWGLIAGDKKNMHCSHLRTHQSCLFGLNTTLCLAASIMQATSTAAVKIN
jgi:hypothetical protein